MSHSQQLPRRKLEELALLHRLEPALASVVVEGPSDRDVLHVFFGRAGARCTVYEVERIEVPGALVESHGCENNHRGRVIAASLELRSMLDPAARIRCVADQDFAAHIGESHDSPFLLLTDWTCMEMYACTADVVQKLVTLVAGNRAISGVEALSAIVPHLNFLFALRLAGRRKKLNLQFVDVTKLMSMNASLVSLDQAVFIERSMRKSSIGSLQSQLQMEAASILAEVAGDPRHWIHGRDFLHLLNWYLAKHGAARVADLDAFKRMLYTALEFHHMRESPLFKALESTCAQ